MKLKSNDQMINERAQSLDDLGQDLQKGLCSDVSEVLKVARKVRSIAAEIARLTSAVR